MIKVRYTRLAHGVVLVVGVIVAICKIVSKIGSRVSNKDAESLSLSL